MQHAVIYARFSSHNQQEQSIDGQLRDCYEYAEKNKIKVVGEYIDRAKSATTDSRPNFQRMIKDSSRHGFDLVLVWKLDRFARNRFDSSTYKYQLKKNGVKLVSVMEPISDDPTSIILESTLEGLAEYYSANLSENVKRGNRESLLAGNAAGGRPGYGYKIVDKKVVVDEKYAEMVRFLFNEYAAGRRKSEITAEINKKGFRTYSGKPFTPHCFTHVIKNRIYIGEYKKSGFTLEVEPLIDIETFEKAQKIAAEHARTPRKDSGKQIYLLTGKVFCGLCKEKMVGTSAHSHTGAVYNYYSCHGRAYGSGCKKKHERQDFLEGYVTEQTVQYLLQPDVIDYVAKEVVRIYSDDCTAARIRDEEAAIARLNREADKLIDALIEMPKSARGKISERLELIEAQRLDAEENLSRLRIEASAKPTEKDIKTWLKRFCGGDPRDPEYQKRIIDLLVSKVYLYDDKILIIYTIKGGEQVSVIEPLDDIIDEATVRISDELVRQKFHYPNLIIKKDALVLVVSR